MADISRFVPTESTTVTFTNSASTTGWVAYRLFSGGLLYTQSLSGVAAGLYTVLVKDSPNGDSRVLYDGTGSAVTAYIAPVTGASSVPDDAFAAAYFSILLTAGTATCKFHGKT
jgi:hypothetical protein